MLPHLLRVKTECNDWRTALHQLVLSSNEVRFDAAHVLGSLSVLQGDISGLSNDLATQRSQARKTRQHIRQVLSRHQSLLSYMEAINTHISHAVKRTIRKKEDLAMLRTELAEFEAERKEVRAAIMTEEMMILSLLDLGMYCIYPLYIHTCMIHHC